jgi:uncharacterized protein (TIRG00374 family)
MKLSKKLKWGILPFKLGIMVFLLWYVLKSVQFDEALEMFYKLPAAAFILSISSQWIVQFAQAFRWRFISNDNQLPYKNYLAYVLLSYPVGMISPSKLVSDTVLAYFLGRKHKLAHKTTSSFLTGKVVGLFILLCFIAVSLPEHLWLIDRVIALLKTFHLKWVYGVIGAALIIGIVFTIYKYQVIIREKTRELFSVFSNIKNLLIIFGYSAVIQIAPILVTYIIFRFLDLPLTFINVLFVIPLVLLISLIPLSPGQIGVRESLIIYFFTLFPGVTKEPLLAIFGFAYLIYVIMIISDLLIAFAILGKWKNPAGILKKRTE